MQHISKRRNDHITQNFRLLSTNATLISGVARGPRGPFHPKFLEDIVILRLERQYPKQNGVIRLKSNIWPAQIFGPATHERFWKITFSRITPQLCPSR